MKSSILIFLGCMMGALALQSAAAADAPSAQPTLKRAAAGKLSMAEKGSFHKVHARKAKTDCDDCHSEEPFADNVLLMSRNRPLAKGSPGVVDPNECYECHRLKSSPPAAYLAR
jgi:uncharacterized membrane protein